MTGVPSEPAPLRVLQSLLWPVMESGACGGPALTGAGPTPTPSDPYRTGLAALGLLGDAAERAPVVVVAEDAHWLDDRDGRRARLRRAPDRGRRDRAADHLTRGDPAQPARCRPPGRQLAPLAAGRRRSAPARPRPALAPRPACASWPRPRAIRSGWWSCWPAPRRTAGASDLAAAQHAARADVRGARRRPPDRHPHRAAGRGAERARGPHRGAGRRQPDQRATRSGWRCSRRRSRPAWSSWPELRPALRPPVDALGDRPGRPRARAPRRPRRARSAPFADDPARARSGTAW